MIPTCTMYYCAYLSHTFSIDTMQTSISNLVRTNLWCFINQSVQLRTWNCKALNNKMLDLQICWDLFNRFNPATFLYLSKASTWISNTIMSSYVFYVGEIDDYQCLKFLFIMFYAIYLVFTSCYNIVKWQKQY